LDSITAARSIIQKLKEVIQTATKNKNIYQLQ